MNGKPAQSFKQPIWETWRGLHCFILYFQRGELIMAPTLFEEKPEPGDLIEIFRPTYQHWAVYIGDGWVIHLVPPSETSQAGAYSLMSVLHDKAFVRMDELSEVVGTAEYHINNLLDDKYEPRSPKAIVEDAKSLVGRKLPYCVFQGNCEHFVTELRYGKAESRQACLVKDVAVGVGVGAAVVGLAVLAASFFGGGNKEKNEQ